MSAAKFELTVKMDELGIIYDAQLIQSITYDEGETNNEKVDFDEAIKSIAHGLLMMINRKSKDKDNADK